MDETILLPLGVETGDLVYSDRNQSIRRVVARFEGFNKEYFVSDHGQRAALLAVRNSEVLLARQYRLLINGISYEIPGGRIENNETPEVAAIRECLEETGFQCFNLKPLFSYHLGLDTLSNYTHIFYAEEIKEIDSGYSSRHSWIPLTDCLNMIVTRKIVDSLSIIALLTYLSFGRKC